MNKSNTENQETPLVSVIVPFYNREAFLAETIESVLGQTFTNWELILVDDGSTDKSAEIAGKFIKEHPSRIHLFSQPQNRGAGAARNLGAKQAKGDYLTFLDSDDVFFSTTLASEIAGFQKYPEADAVCGTADVWYSWSPENAGQNKDFKINLVLETGKLYKAPALFVHNMNARGRKPHFNATLLKRDFIKRIGAFEEDFGSIGEDQVLWAKVSLHGKIYVLDDCLAKYRQHPDSTCARLLSNGIDIDRWQAVFKWLEKYLREQAITDQPVWQALRSFQKRQALEKRFKRFKQIYRRTLPLRLRYKFRDYLTRFKKLLAGPAHRQK